MRVKKIISRIVYTFIPEHSRTAVRLFRFYNRLNCWYVGLSDKRETKKSGFSRLPSVSLRYRVHGAPDIESFLHIGKSSYEDIEKVLQSRGKNIQDFERVVDFGCGCGRTLLWFGKYLENAKLYGTDIDGEAIDWCRKNFEFAKFDVNDRKPPLRYEDNFFDLLIAVSVFTHINEEDQFSWLEEIKRILKPGGMALLSIHGKHYWQNIPEEHAKTLREEGFVFIASDVMKGLFPDWYQSTYHSKSYVLDKYSRYMQTEHFPLALNNNHDLVLLTKQGS